MDDIQKMLHQAGRVLAKVLTGKEVTDDFATVVELLNAEDIMAIAEGLLHERRFGDCEDFLFSSIARNYSDELLTSGEYLIERIYAMDDDLLLANDYSKNEAKAWLEDWLKLRKSEPNVSGAVV